MYIAALPAPTLQDKDRHLHSPDVDTEAQKLHSQKAAEAVFELPTPSTKAGGLLPLPRRALLQAPWPLHTARVTAKGACQQGLGRLRADVFVNSANAPEGTEDSSHMEKDQESF